MCTRLSRETKIKRRDRPNTVSIRHVMVSSVRETVAEDSKIRRIVRRFRRVNQLTRKKNEGVLYGYEFKFTQTCLTYIVIRVNTNQGKY